MTIDELAQDIRFAARSLRNDRGWTGAALLTLAVAIGGCTALFTAVESVVLQPLSFPDAHRLAALEFTPGNDAARGYLNGLPEAGRANRRRHTAFPQYEAWALSSRDLFLHLGVVGDPSVHTFQGERGAERFVAARASASLFPVLGIPPEIGRWPLEEEDEAGAAGAIVLSHALWQERFGGDASVLGTSYLLWDRVLTVVGVMPKEFAFPDGSVQLWASLAGASINANSFNYRIIGRLKTDVPLARASVRLESLPIPAERPDGTRLEWRATAHSLHDETVASARGPLLLLFAAGVAILFIACVNVVNLMLARASAREGEHTVRAALGASPARLARQLLTEGGVLGLVGGTLGFLLALVFTGRIIAMIPVSLPRQGEVGIDGWVLGFSALLSLGSGLAVGMLPALRAFRGNLMSGLSRGGIGASAVRNRTSVREALVVGQVALTLVLLVCGGLLLRSFVGLLATEDGFDPGNVLTFETELPQEKYADPVARLAFYRELLARVHSLPSVRAAALVGYLPARGEFHWTDFRVPGYPSAPDEELTGECFEVSSEYFGAMGIPLAEGRSFRPEELRRPSGPVVISESMARTYWSGRSPLGSQLDLDSGEAFTVVGVAADVTYRGGELGTHRMYLPPSGSSGWMDGLVRLEGKAAFPARELRELTASLDPEVSIFGIVPLEDRLSSSLSRPRFRAVLLGAFALVAVFLAAVGIFGVMSYATMKRAAEYGLRRALGASSGRVWRQVVGRGMRLTLLGGALGMVGSYWATTAVGRYLEGIGPRDPLTFGLCAIFVLVFGVAASLGPALRAKNMDLMQTLRGE